LIHHSSIGDHVTSFEPDEAAITGFNRPQTDAPKIFLIF
jgi:hypothetical protein